MKKFKKSGHCSSRTPLAILNELRTGLDYKVVLADGPPHNPNFLASVEVRSFNFYWYYLYTKFVKVLRLVLCFTNGNI